MRDFGDPNFSTLGENACVFELPGAPSLPNQERIWRLHAAARGLEGVIEAVPGMNNLTLIFNPERSSATALERHLRECAMEAGTRCAAPPRTHVIPVRYSGEDALDFAEACTALGLSEREFIALHSEREYRVYFVGFMPGFAYLGDVDERLILPRRATPRSRVARGSVAIAGRMTAIYPFDSPGGWNVIGRTDCVCFEPSRTPPALFAPGDAVRFVEVR